MKHSRKPVLRLIVLILVSTYLTVYTFKAHAVASMYIYEDEETGIVFWRSGPAGSLFPLPRKPGMLEILVQVDVIDLFIYAFLIKLWLLAGLSVLLWFITGLYTLRLARVKLM